MSYKAETYRRTGNGKMAAEIKQLAKDCGLRINHFSADGWVLKSISITVYGHEADLYTFQSRLPDGVQS
jgi:hypothetical protein